MFKSYVERAKELSLIIDNREEFYNSFNEIVLNIDTNEELYNFKMYFIGLGLCEEQANYLLAGFVLGLKD
jgi:hypothetical protein